ncbi:MAG: hypothetical protein L0216_19150 [Planctomycetales bacterium]|nr:hypothetical protein [Planctomycetales bacterium]
MRRSGFLLATTVGLLASAGCASVGEEGGRARLVLRSEAAVAQVLTQDEEEDAFYRPPEKPRRPIAPGPGPELSGTKSAADAEGEPRPERRLSIGAAYLRTDEMEGSYFAGEYEFGLGKGFTLSVRGDGFRYGWDNGVDLAPGDRREEREGWGTGVGFELRLYVLGVALDGLSMGFGGTLAPVARWTSRDDRDKSGAFGDEEIEESRSVLAETHLSVGYSFELVRGLSVTPAAIAGAMNPGDEAVSYAGAGLWVSYRF